MTERAARPTRLYPWQDRRGEFSALKTIVFVGVFLPGLWLLARLALGTLGPRPMIEINHQAGLWAIRFLLATLAVTPLRYVWRWPELVFVRRTLGLAVFFYAVIHLVAYAGDLAWDIPKVASEIIARIYLAIGFIALIMLVPLAITSTNGMMKRMGGIQWRALHVLIYPIMALAAVHFFLQSKLGVTEPIVVAASAIWLGLWRLIAARLGENRIASLAGATTLAVAVVIGTAFGEALYYHWKVGVAIGRVLPSNFMLKAGTRPAWIMLGIAVLVIAVAACRAYLAAKAPKRPRASGRRVGNEA
ncbi:sulfoxide reductase heme-binding subunit YedZ [Kaistia dalseonensis]|uniref:Protein-methionine-sulfoxide reductase heme-binding subunit MsrQ n=1 Tax=Kaistia dalseonensis TaxID=410840 RepID=A0ABU0H363_9HYPH|nr:protein-methionine-sulfoxide reductase heme-binding subunit MsrQ [Kaistia dalseonensis]MCX5494166.1 sulfoxide reductase heme-binding subunit YedZ [Kaistia dalseonensis]MDQ0436745.1 sulfoxide reductase heme-binding subunit YedZ [Kaistia dalseonensis]